MTRLKSKPEARMVLKRLAAGSVTVSASLTVLALALHFIALGEVFTTTGLRFVVGLAEGYLLLTAAVFIIALLSQVLSIITPLPPVVEVEGHE